MGNDALVEIIEKNDLSFTPDQLDNYAEQLGDQPDDFQANNLQDLLLVHEILPENIVSVKALKPHELLTEVPPMFIIGRNVLVITYKKTALESTSESIDPEVGILTVGTIPHPGYAPGVTECCLAIAQVASTQMEGENNKKDWPPMVKDMTIGWVKDLKIPNGKSLLIATTNTVNGRNNNIEGVVYYSSPNGVEEVASGKLNLMRLPISKIAKFSDRNSEVSEKAAQSHAQNYLATAEKIFPDLPVPYYGIDLVLACNAQTGPNQRSAIINLGKNIGEDPSKLFPGHFPNYPIVPLAGVVGPVLMLIEKRFQELTGLRPEEFSLRESGAIEIQSPISPSDVLLIEANEIDGSNGEKAFKIICYYFDKKGEKQIAVTFQKLVIGKSNRHDQPWNNKNVADAFALQATILEKAYKKGHLDVFQKILEESVAGMLTENTKEHLNILDLGTGEQANIPFLVLQVAEKLHKDLRSKISELDFTISDVTPLILQEAKRVVSDFLANNVTFKEKVIAPENVDVKEIVINVRSAVSAELDGKITVIPELKDQQGTFQLITANFALDYAEDPGAELQKAYELLQSGGEIVVGFVLKNPPYHLLAPEVMPELEKNDWKDLGSAQIMTEIGRLLARCSALGGSRIANYQDPEKLEKILKEIGFTNLIFQKNTFGGVGFIVRAKHP